MLDSSTHSADLLNQLPSPLDVASGSNFLPSDPLRSSLDLLSFSDRSSFTPNSFIQALSPLPINGFNSGYFTVGDTGQVGIDYLFDGGGYQGELAIFSLSGLEDFATDLSTLTNEVVHRALSETVLGHVVIRDAIEGARFNGELGEGNFNVGDHLDVKTFTMTAGDRFGVMLAPNGMISALQNNPNPQGVDRPLFSLVGLNPEFGFQVGQMADVNGNGSTFVLEDLRMDGESDRDYNDMIFQVRGAIGSAVSLDEVIPFDNDWRESTLGQGLLEYAAAYDNPRLPNPIRYEFPLANQPLIGIIDTGFAANNPDIDYSRITLGRDWVDNDADPLLTAGTGNEHGTHVIGIIGATQNNGLGIDGINDQAPLWVGRAIGSGKWAESLVEFVDKARQDGQPNAVVNLSLDLTQKNPDGSTSTRYEFTPEERKAIEYARQNGVLIVAAAGNEAGVMSVLGQASQEFDNIITVGAANGGDRADYSSYGAGLDILAPGGVTSDPVLSTVAQGVGTMVGSSVATAEVTGAISQVWAANPGLNYRQVIDLVKQTATDLKTPGWDAETGAGLLNLDKAVSLAKVTQPKAYQPKPWFEPGMWEGEGTVIALEYAVGKDDLYVAIGNGDVWQRNTKTGVQTLAYQGFTGQAFTDLAISPDGRLFASTFSMLHEINPATRTERFVGVLTPDPAIPGYAVMLNALEFAQDGKLYGAEETGRIYIVDPATAKMELIGNLGGQSSGDLVIDGNKLYVTARGVRSGSNDRLIAFDLSTRTSQVISSNLGIADLYGLAMQDGKLIGYSRLGQQVTINPITGASVMGGRLSYASELRGVSLQTQDSTPPPFVPGGETNPVPPAPSPGQKGVPEDAGRSRKTHVSQNGVVVHYYDNGHLIVQPNGEGFWYGRVQLLGAKRELWDVAPISLTDPDGDDVALRAKSLTSSNGTFSVSRSGEIGGANDQNDWYKFTITSPQLVKLKLTGAYAGSDMLLWNLLQDSSDDASIGDGDYREINRILAPGTYHVQIDGNPDRKTPYNLQVSAKGLEGKVFRGELGEAYVIESGKRWVVPFEKTEEYLSRHWDNLERMRQEDLEQIPFGGEYQTRWNRAIASEYGVTRNLLGSETGEIVTAGQSRQGTTGYFQRFERGTIHWSAKYGAVAVWQELQQVYNQTGGSSGWLGFPTRREYDFSGGKRTDFEGGFIFWTPQLGARVYKPGETPILTPPYTPPPITPNPNPGSGNPITNPAGFTAVSFSHSVGVDTNVGIRLRTNTYLNAPFEGVTHDSSFEFDGWKYGEPVSDRTVADGRMDALWYRIKGTNHWVPSAFINGYPPNNPPTLPGGANPITDPGNLGDGSINNSGVEVSVKPQLKLGLIRTGTVNLLLADALSNVVNNGKTTWDTLKDNTSTSSPFDEANALPNDISDSQLRGWQKGSFTFPYKVNFLGSSLTMVDIDVLMSWDYGGSFDGQGRYLKTIRATGKVKSQWLGQQIKIIIDFDDKPEYKGPKDNPVVVMGFTLKIERSEFLSRYPDEVWEGKIRADTGSLYLNQL